MDWRAAEREYTDDIIGETTIPQLFFDSVERYDEMVAQQYKGGVYDRALVAGGIIPAADPGAYADLSYARMGQIVRNLAGGFRALGVGPDDRVSIYADTRLEWIHADMAIQTTGGVVTTVYTESSPGQVEYLLNDPAAKGVVVENEELLHTIRKVEEEVNIEFAILFDDAETADVLEADVYTLDEVHDMGADEYDAAEVESWLDDRDWEDLSSLVYTSGTTGDPKGVKLSHKNWRTVINQLRKRIGPRPDKPPEMPKLEPGKTAIAFLPIAHAFERVNHFQSIASGITIAYAASTETIGDDIEVIKPNMAAAVPRVYERIYNAIREQAAESPIKKRIFDWAIGVAQTYDRAENPGLVLRTKHGIADRLVYSKVREALGNNIEMFVSGGGSLSEELARLYRAMGITIIEGYGLTETAPAVSFNPPEDIRVGSMGAPLVDVDVKLDQSVVSAETKANVGPGREVGELLVNGPNVFSGYWNKEDATAAAFDGEWFRTGDIVSIDDEYLRFVDRRKNLIVLDTGKNVAPEPIEDEFSTSPRVDQIMVVGDDEKFIGAIIKPNFEELESWADDEGHDIPSEPATAIEDSRVQEWILEEVERVNQHLAKHETIKEFALVADEWTPENDLLTPSMKKKRRNIRAEYESHLETLYTED